MDGQIYVFDPMCLELFHVYSQDDIDILYESVILDRRKNVKLSPKFFFDKYDRKIKVVSMDISHGCTLRCSYCYLSAGYHKKEMMSKNQFLDLLKFLAKTESNGITFYFAGEGVPTLNYRLLRQIPELCREYGFNDCHFEITTNGTLLSPSMIKFFEKEKFSVSVSLDGNEENDSKPIFARKILEDVKRIKCRTISFIGCSAAINSFYFNLKGDIYVCSSHNSCKELCVGNIRDGIDYDKIETNSYYPKIVESYDGCKKCWLRHLCSGSCLAAKWLESKDTSKPSEYHCQLNKIYWEAIIKIYILVRPYIKGNINFMD